MSSAENRGYAQLHLKPIVSVAPQPIHVGTPPNFALQAFFLSQDPLYRKLHDYYQKSFGVHLIGFVRDHNDFSQLEIIAKTWAEQIEVRPPALTEDLEYMDEVLD